MNITVDAARWHRISGILRREFTELAIISAYLYVCFGSLLLFKTATLRAYGIGFAPWGIGAIKALVLGKFILIGNDIGIGSRQVGTRLIHSLAYKVAVFACFLFLLLLLEEIALALLHGHPATAAFRDFGTWLQIVASCILLCLILIPYFVLGAIGEVLGPGSLARMFFGEREKRNRRCA